jgi:subtilisin family serine protease
VRGTSYAAPLVAAHLAAQLSAPEPARAQSAVAAIRNQARDLGTRGRDNIYGYGLVTAP